MQDLFNSTESIFYFTHIDQMLTPVLATDFDILVQTSHAKISLLSLRTLNF